MSKGIFVKFRLVDVDLDDLRVAGVVFGVVSGLSNAETRPDSDIKVTALDRKIGTPLSKGSRSSDIEGMNPLANVVGVSCCDKRGLEILDEREELFFGMSGSLADMK